MLALMVSVFPSHSAVAASSIDIIYNLNSDFQQSFHYSDSGTTQYDENTLGTRGIMDASSNHQWILVSQWQGFTGAHANMEELVALSSNGQRVSYGYYYDEGSMTEECTGSTRFYTTGDALFSKVSSSTAPKKVYFLGVTTACSGGMVSWSKSTLRLYSATANSASRKAISPKLSAEEGEFNLIGTATNGYALFTTGKRNFVVSSTGKTILKASTSIGAMQLSANGKKIAYEKHGTSKAIYVADSNGNHSKKVASLASDNTKLLGISQTGSYILYQRYLADSAAHIGIYSYRASTKKTSLIDSGYDGGYNGFDYIWNNAIKWVPGSNTFIYAFHDAQAKSTGITQIDATGANKITPVPLNYDSTNSVYLF